MMKVFIIQMHSPMRFLAENSKKISLMAILVLAVSFCIGLSAPVSAFGGVFAGTDIFDRKMRLAEKTPQEGKRIDISLVAQTLTFYQDGKAVGSYKISSGKKSMPTPKGNFQIYNKTRRAWSAEYKLFMPYWMAFTPDGSRGIHELPEWPNGRKEGAAHLGIPVSHGCVRLGVGAAKTLYDWTPVGTPVIIH